MSVESLSPREAVDMWLQRQSTERAEETIQSYRYRLDQFVRWCNKEGIDDLADLTVADVLRFDSDCRGDLSAATLQNRFGTLRRFLSFCDDIGVVPEDLHETVDVPELIKAQRVNEEKLASRRAEEILAHLDRFEYASRKHALLLLSWHTTCRLGSLRALDVTDVYLSEEDLDRLLHYPEIDQRDYEEILETVEPPFVFFRHRPDQDTPLKNKYDGQRPVALDEDVGTTLRAYIRVNRVDKTDEFGRAPLFTTERGDGRMSKAAIRRVFYIVTQPCRIDGECPHERDVETCEAREHGLESRCPSTRSPHPIRTGSITKHRDDGWPIDSLAERANASAEVIREHYDHPDLLKRMQSRRQYLDMEDDDA